MSRATIGFVGSPVGVLSVEARTAFSLFVRQLAGADIGSIRASLASSSEPIDLESKITVDGGPCRDRTYDQLIKRSFLARVLLPSKTSTYASQVVPRFVDLRIEKALNVLLSRFSNGTVVYRYELSLSNLQPADRMCIELT
jgi:hypothetical protein